MSQNAVDPGGAATTNFDHCDDAHRFDKSIIRQRLTTFNVKKNNSGFSKRDNERATSTRARAALSGLLSTTANSPIRLRDQ